MLVREKEKREGRVGRKGEGREGGKKEERKRKKEKEKQGKKTPLLVIMVGHSNSRDVETWRKCVS